MVFELGRFFRRRTDGIVYRCEQIRDVRALLHVADIHASADCERRIIIRENDANDWEMVAESDEAPYVTTYSRDVFEEYGTEVVERSIVYRRQYYIDPYLRGVTDSEIRSRLEAIVDNSIRYDSNGAPQLLPPVEDAFWHRKSEEVLEHLRSNGREDFFVESESIPGAKVLKLHHDIRKKQGYANCAPWGRVPVLSQHTPRTLFKFGAAKYLRPAIEEGRFRIAPASSYSDPSLNSARQDSDERRIVLRPSSTGFPVVLQDHTGKTILKSSDHLHKRIGIEIGGDQDYFVWCCSKTYEPRLFVDFQADACLVIRDLSEFAHRLNRGLYAKVPNAPGMRADDVRYYDPLLPDDALSQMVKTPMVLFFYKDFRYTYQAEYRFVWMLKEKSVLAPVEIDIGPLTDICELVELSADAKK